MTKRRECGCELTKVSGGWAFIDSFCKKCEKHKDIHPHVAEYIEMGAIKDVKLD